MFGVMGVAWGQTVPTLTSPAALVKNAPSINGTVQGDVQVMLGQGFSFNSNAQVTGNVFVLGTPTVQINGSPQYSGTVNASGTSAPTNYTVTLNSGAKLGYLVRRTNAATFATVSNPPSPTGTRDVSVNSSTNTSGQIGSWSTLHNLTLNSNVGAVMVPAGSYGTFTANSNSSFVLGTAGATTPSTYSFDGITLNSSNTSITVVGPVVIQIKNSVTVNSGGTFGNSSHPDWTSLTIANSGLTINSGGIVYAYVQAPTSTVTINNKLVGSVVSANSLTVSSGAVLQYQAPTTAAPTVSITSPGSGSVVQGYAALLIQASASISSGSISKVDFYANNGQGNVKIGSSTASPYGFTWNPAPGNYSLTAIATSSQGTTATSSAVTVDVNAAPSMVIGTSATNGVILAGGNITITSGATDSDGSISLVQFYANAQLIGQSTTSPYSFTWSNVAGGTYQITVKATDNQGGVTTSSPFSITSDIPPTVSLTAPASGTQVQLPASVTLTATAADSDGTIASVTFYADSGSGAIQVGQATHAPYTATWQQPAVGTYQVAAMATDNLGATTMSSSVQLVVGAPPPAPVMGSLAGGADSTLVIKTNGSVEGWGRNQFGQLGLLVGTDVLTPTPVPNISGAIAVAMGSSHSLALTSTGTVLSFGDNYFGQLGDGTTTDHSMPTPISVPTQNGATVIAIAAGDGFSVALESDGSVYTWGSNAKGQLGQNDQVDRLAPTKINGLPVIKAIVAGRSFVVALTDAKTLVAWGENQWGQIGDGTTTMRLSSVPIGGLSSISSIAAGANHALAVDTNGNLWAWGENAFAQAGDASLITKLSPQTVPGISGATATVGGWNHSLVVTTAQSVMAFGANDEGQLGDGTVVDKPTPVTIPNLSAVVIGAGFDHSATMALDRTLFMSGRNAHGQLGAGTTTSTSTPTPTTY